jgi:hypothetical protein
VGEGKKYKTIEDLARSRLEADKFIETLKGEAAELRQHLAERARIEELLDRLDAQKDDRLPGDDNQNSQAKAGASPDIEQLIETKLTRREQERARQDNLNRVRTELEKLFGANYSERIEAKRIELGFSREEMNEIAGRSPKALLQLVTPKPAGTGYTPPPVSSASSDRLSSPGAPQPRTMAWYEQIRKTDKEKYWSPEVQMQLHKDAIAAAKEGKEF